VWARTVRRDLLTAHEFGLHEILTLDRALTWWDITDGLLEESRVLVGRERDARLKAAGDASASALRCWRTLKFTDPTHPARRPGRPSGPNWSAVRKAGHEAQQKAMALRNA
jgi:hypothetical protein